MWSDLFVWPVTILAAGFWTRCSLSSWFFDVPLKQLLQLSNFDKTSDTAVAFTVFLFRYWHSLPQCRWKKYDFITELTWFVISRFLSRINQRTLTVSERGITDCLMWVESTDDRDLWWLQFFIVKLELFTVIHTFYLNNIPHQCKKQ